MAFHPDKCSVLTITNKKNPVKHNYLLHNHTLESVSSAKYLGITLQSEASVMYNNEDNGFVYDGVELKYPSHSLSNSWWGLIRKQCYISFIIQMTIIR
jgi:hypothetical protein